MGLGAFYNLTHLNINKLISNTADPNMYWKRCPNGKMFKEMIQNTKLTKDKTYKKVVYTLDFSVWNLVVFAGL